MLSLRPFRDATSKLSLRKKLVILASVGVLLPVLGLTYLQYRSLTELQNNTKGAFKDNLRQGLTYVEQQMEKRLDDIGDQTLDELERMPLSSPNTAEELEKHFIYVKRSQPEVEEVFVFRYAGDSQKTNAFAYAYSDRFSKVAKAEFTAAQSDTMSLFDRAQMAQSFLEGNRKYLFVPSPGQGAYLFYPLQKESGFVGVLLSERFVRDDLLVGSMNKVSKLFHGNTASLSSLAITISDETGHVLFSNSPAQHGYFLETNFDRPFSNWKAQVGLKNANLDDLARNSFLHSAGVTLLVLLFLFTGMALIIRATDREARLAQAKSNFVSNVSH